MAIQNQNDINGLDLEIGQVTIRNTILKIVFWLKLSKKSIKFQVDNNNKNTSSLHEACFINTSIGYLGILGVCTRGKYIYIANSDSLLNERLIWLFNDSADFKSLPNGFSITNRLKPFVLVRPDDFKKSEITPKNWGAIAK